MERDEKVEYRIFQVSESTLYDTLMMDTSNNTVVQNHRLYNTQSEF